MFRKLYGRYNKRSQQLETIFLMPNDNEALYNFSLSHIEAKKNNPYHDEDNYQLICLGVLEMEGENCGIIYNYSKDYPVKFDEIPDGLKPKHNVNGTENITVNDKELKEKLINESRRM